MSEFYTRDEVRNPSIDGDRDTDDALNESVSAEEELAVGTVDFDATAGNEPLDTPISAGSVPNSTMEADLGPAPTESFTNSGTGNGDASLSGGLIGTGVNEDQPMSSEPMSDINLPYNKQPEIPAPVEPVHLGDIHVKETASQAVGAAKEIAGQALTQGKEIAGQALDQAKVQVKSQLGEQKDRAAESLNGLNMSVQQFGETFRQNNLPQLAEYTDALAEHVDRVSEYVKNNDVDVLIRDAEQFAKQNAGAFLAGAFILGIAVGRFLRSSERNMAYSGEKNALVPVERMDTYGNMTKGRQDIDGDDTIEQGHKPLHAQDYVPGGVLGGAPA